MDETRFIAGLSPYMVKTGLPLVPSPFKGLSALLPSGVLGVPVPCPILPTESMRSLSVEAVASANVLSAGLKIDASADGALPLALR